MHRELRRAHLTHVMFCGMCRFQPACSVHYSLDYAVAVVSSWFHERGLPNADASKAMPIEDVLTLVASMACYQAQPELPAASVLEFNSEIVQAAASATPDASSISMPFKPKRKKPARERTNLKHEDHEHELRRCVLPLARALLCVCVCVC